MTTAACLLVYAAIVIWLAPPVLDRLTRRGLSPRLGVAAWVTAVAGVLIAWLAAVVLIVVKSVFSLANSQAIVLCLELLGIPERALTSGRLGPALLICAALAISTAVAGKVVGSILELRSRSREHARTARLVGLPAGPDLFLVAAAQPAAYCVGGRPRAIVVTTAALERLDESQLAAVLAHESAHIAGRHHDLVTALRALRVGLPHLPLFARSDSAVAALLEMCADDAAARRHCGRILVAGMIRLAGPHPRAGLAIAATAVVARADRLLDPARRATVWCHRLTVSVVIAALASAPVAINTICHH